MLKHPLIYKAGHRDCYGDTLEAQNMWDDLDKTWKIEFSSVGIFSLISQVSAYHLLMGIWNLFSFWDIVLMGKRENANS